MDMTLRLPEIAAELTQQAREAFLSVQDLRTACPWLCRQIVRDAATVGLFDLWNRSSNFDDLAGVAIVEPTVLAVIGQLAQLPLMHPIVHAGLQHTYGYLLSTVVTPYGFKRDRWLSPRLEQGFGLPLDTLGPAPKHGTLLANATLFAGQVAFREDERAMERLCQIAPAAAPAVRKVDVTRFEQTRILETLSLRDALGRFRTVKIRTDLVPFPIDVENCLENCLLVYSVEDSDNPGARLTTLFTVTDPVVAELTSADRFGPVVEIRTRFNAVIPGMSIQPLLGKRIIQRFTC
jgi:hypothetical protein